MKEEVYSWRLSGELKSDLEREARLRRMPVSSVLDLAVRDWLKKSGADVAGDEVQRALHAGAERCLGRYRQRQFSPRRNSAQVRPRPDPTPPRTHPCPLAP